jgi:formylglycine-generating enzyme required for sulfatase activity
MGAARLRLVALAGTASAVALVSCAALVRLDGYELSSDAAVNGDVTRSDAQAPADGGDPSEGGSITCPNLTRGPALVPAGRFCIDSTEVTMKQYAAFLASQSSASVPQPPECSFNVDFTPGGGSLDASSDLPVTHVDWCDAYAFCKWSGKRLCGAFDGGTLAYDQSATDPAASMWFYACTRGDGRRFPYGNAFDPNACHWDAAATVPVDGKPKCVGGFPGIFGMSGNAREWEDACDTSSADAGRDQKCHTRGGSYQETSDKDLTCAKNEPKSRDDTSSQNGFRCCWP